MAWTSASAFSDLPYARQVRDVDRHSGRLGEARSSTAGFNLTRETFSTLYEAERMRLQNRERCCVKSG
jgi:hypothetical protein